VDAVSGNGMSIILGVDLDADTCSLWWDAGRTGSYTPIYTGTALGAAAASFEAPYFRCTQFNGSNPIGIDMLLYGTNFNDVAAPGALSPYESWLAAYGLTGVDDDNDGLPNLGEYGLGGNPTNGFVDGYLPIFGMNGTEMLYIHARRTDDTNLTYVLESSTNLVSGVWTNMGYTLIGTNTALAGNFEEVTNSIPASGQNMFIQLVIEEANQK
jgi:hypothetical protein